MFLSGQTLQATRPPLGIDIYALIRYLTSLDDASALKVLNRLHW